MSKEAEIIKLWGTPQSFYNFKKEFLEEHADAHLRTFDSDGDLVSVTYMFSPYQVWLDNESLKEAIREANKEGEE